PYERRECAILRQLSRGHLPEDGCYDEHHETAGDEKYGADAEQYLRVCTHEHEERECAEHDSHADRGEDDDQRALSVSFGLCEFRDERSRDGRRNDEEDGPQDRGE